MLINALIILGGVAIILFLLSTFIAHAKAQRRFEVALAEHERFAAEVKARIQRGGRQMMD